VRAATASGGRLLFPDQAAPERASSGHACCCETELTQKVVKIKGTWVTFLALSHLECKFRAAKRAAFGRAAPL